MADRIYRIYLDKGDNNKIKGELMYSGDLNLDTYHPIETLPFYETSSIRKVYWTDGKNQPRVINIGMGSSAKAKLDDGSFDFIQDLSYSESIGISKTSLGNGVFPAGTIQYFFTYFNKYSQESNIFYSSQLYYNTKLSRGCGKDETSGSSYHITISNPDTRFDYVRIYCVQRSSHESTPIVKRVMDVPINGSTELSVIDSNVNGETIDPTILSYLGGEKITVDTLASKDNTLFIGGITLKRESIGSSISSELRALSSGITFSQKSMYSVDDSSGNYYRYSPSLDRKSTQQHTFKWNDTYRFGVQFQHDTGSWSEVVFIGDATDSIAPSIVHSGTSISISGSSAGVSIPASIQQKLIALGYKRMRGVVVYPMINDRNVICQGVLNPTVFNVSDRGSNSPYSMASWYFRPTMISSMDVTDYSSTPFNNAKYGFPVEFRHNKCLTNNANKNCEIQVLCDYGLTKVKNSSGVWVDENYDKRWKYENRSIDGTRSGYPYVIPDLVNLDTANSMEKNEFISKFRENFGIDQSVVTLNSPDIEFDDSVKLLDKGEFGMRIVGYIPFTGFVSDYDITTENGPHEESAPGFVKKVCSRTNYDSTYGANAMVSTPSYIDELVGVSESSSNKWFSAFVTYPWHSKRSLSNTPTSDSTPAMLKQKRMSNLRFSGWTEYLSTPKSYGITPIRMITSNEHIVTGIQLPENCLIADQLTYVGNVDMLVGSNPKSIEDYDCKTDGFRLQRIDLSKLSVTDTGTTVSVADSNLEQYYNGPYCEINGLSNKTAYQDIPRSGMNVANIRFNSTPHAVFALDWSKSGSSYIQNILPKPSTSSYSPNGNTISPYWIAGSDTVGVACESIAVSNPMAGGLWLAELYRKPETISNRFGGTGLETLVNASWVPCGEPIKLSSTSATLLQFSDGDTYIQRYDCLKTYPASLDDYQSMVEILSFYCETHMNLDCGRYDSHRGETNNMTMLPSNFNLINDSYTQGDDFLKYHALDYSRFSMDSFPNTVSWTKTKTLGEITDTWTNITLANALDTNGDLGKIRALKVFNNDIYGFQDKGIFKVLFNSRVQISTSDGVPVEIASSSKVEGKLYLNGDFGTRNKWSIIQTPSGLYFMDDLSKSIDMIGSDGVVSLSDKLGMHSWVVQNLTDNSPWMPQSFNNFVSQYDRINDDVYFTNGNTCLDFSERMGVFSSFMSYELTPFMFNAWNRFIAIRHSNNDGRLEKTTVDGVTGYRFKLWNQNQGYHSYFFDKVRPYYTELVVNPEILNDKVFTNIEFNADTYIDTSDMKSSFLPQSTFDTLSVWNEYQGSRESSNDVNLYERSCSPSPLKEKFRRWRANIPRNQARMVVGSRPNNPFGTYDSERMRGYWMHLKLAMNNPQKGYKTILHDLTVFYLG